jgi:hypothetical protein
MRGKVRIENEKGLSISRSYNWRKDREQLIAEIIKRYRLTNYIITIIPDDNETNRQNIEHHGSGTVHRAYCSPCVVH